MNTVKEKNVELIDKNGKCQYFVATYLIMSLLHFHKPCSSKGSTQMTHYAFLSFFNNLFLIFLVLS